jgi:hypothetical protein
VIGVCRAVGALRFQVTDDDVALARAAGFSGTQLIELAIHRRLDQLGIPRDGRR